MKDGAEGAGEIEGAVPSGNETPIHQFAEEAKKAESAEDGVNPVGKGAEGVDADTRGAVVDGAEGGEGVDVESAVGARVDAGGAEKK